MGEKSSLESRPPEGWGESTNTRQRSSRRGLKALSAGSLRILMASRSVSLMSTPVTGGRAAKALMPWTSLRIEAALTALSGCNKHPEVFALTEKWRQQVQKTASRSPASVLNWAMRSATSQAVSRESGEAKRLDPGKLKWQRKICFSCQGGEFKGQRANDDELNSHLPYELHSFRECSLAGASNHNVLCRATCDVRMKLRLKLTSCQGPQRHPSRPLHFAEHL